MAKTLQKFVACAALVAATLGSVAAQAEPVRPAASKLAMKPAVVQDEDDGTGTGIGTGFVAVTAAVAAGLGLYVAIDRAGDDEQLPNSDD